MKSVLFVCLGNICRSPLAEGIAKEYVLENGLNITVDSCGTGDWHSGEPPCANSIKVAKNRGIDISLQVSRQVKKEDFEVFDKIIALDASNMADLLALGCPEEKLSKLGTYGYDGEDVPDPYFFKGFDGFEKVFGMIEACVTTLLHKQKV